MEGTGNKRPRNDKSDGMAADRDDGIWLEERISEAVKRASTVSAPLMRNVENGKLCSAALLSYFTSVITVDKDFSFIGQPLFRGNMCDNFLLQAGICTLGPLPNVFFLSTVCYPRLFRSMDGYKCSIRERRRFVYKLEPYDMLIEATSVFERMPTIILPINFSLHWCYVIVIPYIGSGSAKIIWGDSLRYSPRSGLLETVRLYLVLLYRGAQFLISERNHALDVLGFAEQKDGFGCGFYILAVMSRFASASSDDRFPVRGFEEYDRGLTERYREVCIRSYVLHILCVATSQPPSAHFGLPETSTSLRMECRKLLEAANAGVPNMYPDIEVYKLLAIRRENSCEVVRGVAIIDGNGNLEREEGLSSKLYAGDGAKPFIRTSFNDSGNESLYFGDVVDLGTVFNSTRSRHGDNLHLVSPVLQEAAVEKREVGACSAVANDLPATTRPKAVGVPLTSALPISSLCNEAMPETEGAEEENGVPRMSYDTEEACHNIFAYLAQRLSEGHLLRKPEYQQLRGGDFRFRLRLRCRFYDSPPGYNANVGCYRRCEARLYARLLRNGGGWRLSFRFRHTHAVWEHARLGEEVIHKHFVDGCWEVAPVQHGSSSDGKKPGPKGLGGEVSDLYIGIAPRPDSVCPPQERVENLVELVSDCASGEQVPGVGWCGDSDLVPLSVEYTDILRKHVQGCVVTCDGQDVKDELKYLSECFGFPMVVQNLQYFHAESESEHVSPQVRRLTFRCPVGENNRLRKDCQYWFTVVSAAPSYVSDHREVLRTHGDSPLRRHFVINFRERWHTHKPDEGSLRRSLPAYVWRDAVNLKDKSLIRTGDIVRYLEDHYNLRVERKFLSRKLRWEMGKRHPAERDCQDLVSNLMKYTQLNPGMFFEARVNRDNALHSVFWGFPKWREEYRQFGIIPGVTIDARAVANNYDTPLAFICGRTNNKQHTSTGESFDYYSRASAINSLVYRHKST